LPTAVTGERVEWPVHRGLVQTTMGSMATQVVPLVGVSRPRRLVREHPLGAALTLFGTFELVHVAFIWDGGSLLRQLSSGLPPAWSGTFAWAIYASTALVTVAVLAWWRETGLTRPGRVAAWPLVLLPLAAGTPFLAVGLNVGADAVLPVLVIGTLLIALNEELFFRGILLETLRPLGWRRSIMTAAVLFGCAHLLNLPAGANAAFTVLQVAATTAGGVTLAAIRIRSGSLWPLIAVHAVMDAIALATLTGAGVDSPLLIPVVLAWGALNAALWPIGWRLLRGRTEGELTALYESD
jgi:CAAX protease family protein